MLHELPYHRMLIMTEGHLGVFSAKTACSVIRYRPADCVGVLDSAAPDKPLSELVAGLSPLPIFRSVAAALATSPDALLVGIAPTGGQLPPVMRAHIADALRAGISIINGLHVMLNDDPELAELAARHGAKLHDVRDATGCTHVARGRARQMPVRRVLTVGTDCNVGKMVTALELRRAARDAGVDAAFVPTGQTGIMIDGWGLAIDHVLSDFTAGAVELMIERVADKPVCFVEGQGSIEHPGYSGVTCSLVHGACPDAMVMCHCPTRTLHNGWADCPIAPLADQIALYERLLAPLHPGKVVAIALNTVEMTPADAETAIRRIQDDTGLPTADPIRTGVGDLWRAIRAALGL